MTQRDGLQLAGWGDGGGQANPARLSTGRVAVCGGLPSHEQGAPIVIQSILCRNFAFFFLLSNWTRGSRNSAPPPSGGITEHRPLRCKGCPAPAEGTDVTRGSSTDRGNARLAAVPNWGPPQEISTAYSACAQTLTGSRGTASNTNKQTNTQTRQGLLV